MENKHIIYYYTILSVLFQELFEKMYISSVIKFVIISNDFRYAISDVCGTTGAILHKIKNMLHYF